MENHVKLAGNLWKSCKTRWTSMKIKSMEIVQKSLKIDENLANIAAIQGRSGKNRWNSIRIMQNFAEKQRTSNIMQKSLKLVENQAKNRWKSHKFMKIMIETLWTLCKNRWKPVTFMQNWLKMKIYKNHAGIAENQWKSCTNRWQSQKITQKSLNICENRAKISENQ